MEDLIRRSDAIKAVENLSENYTKEGDREWHPHIDFITQELVQVPSVFPKQNERTMNNWIFCKDSLPSEHGRYLVVYPLSNINIKPYIIDILDYGIVYPDQSNPFFFAFDPEFGDVEYDDVIAWMPLPKLWEGVDDE